MVGFACSNAPAEVEFAEGNVLRITGVSVTTITSTARFDLPALGEITSSGKRPLEFNKITQEIIRVLLELNLADWMIPGTTKSRSLCQVLSGGRLPDLFESFVEPFMEGLYDIYKIGEIKKMHVAPMMAALLELFIIAACHRRSIFRTQDGNIGLGPMSAKADDRVTVMLGCNKPLILRPKEHGSDCHYQFIGESFLPHIAHGEALLAPLPENFVYSPNWVKNSKGETVGADQWMDRNTKSLMDEDPRFAKLPIPAGWERVDHINKNQYTKWGNRESGESLSGGHDPRLFAQCLRDLGVDLEIFSLI